MPFANELPKVSPAQFYTENKAAINDSVAAIGCQLNDFLCVLHFETAGTYNPAVKNKYSGAVGLIQFTSGAASDLGTSRSKLEKMTVAEQLTYVVNYFKLPNRRAPYKDVGDLYLAVFYPAARKYGEYDIVISQANAPITYHNNRGLDKDQDGNIYRYEITERIKQHYASWFSSPVPALVPVPPVPTDEMPILNDTAASEAQQGKILDGDYTSKKKLSSLPLPSVAAASGHIGSGGGGVKNKRGKAKQQQHPNRKK